MQRLVADISSSKHQAPPIFQRGLDEDAPGVEESSTGWLACGARIHLEPPPVRYPALNVPPQGLCRPDFSAPVRYPVFNVPAIAATRAEAVPPVRYPAFSQGALDALRADAAILYRNEAQYMFTERRGSGNGDARSANVWLGRGLSFGLHASLVAFIAFFASNNDMGDAKYSNDMAGVIEVALEPIASVTQETPPPEPINEPALEQEPEETKPEELTPDEPKPLDTPILTTSNTHADAVAPKIEEKKPEEDKKPPKPKPKPKPRPAAGGAPATQGSVNAYAAMVRSRIASRKPGGGGQKGSATVSFAISGSGGLSYARISHSSGSSSLDAMALQAVRSSAPFPPPPGGQRLNMAIPFYFR